MKRTLNATINRSKSEKNDEHYTQLADIENEVRHYRDQFRGKTVLCNCDDPRCSNFFKYFTRSFEILGLKRVIATCYKSQDVDLFTQKTCEKSGIVPYLLDGDERYLSIRAFDDEERLAAYTRQGGKCPKCGKKFAIEEMQAITSRRGRRGARPLRRTARCSARIAIGGKVTYKR